MIVDELIKIKPYSLAKTKKSAILTQMLTELTIHHYENCRQYKNILDGFGFNPYSEISHYNELPMIPVRLFKELQLKSVSEDSLTKSMTSSGSSGQKVSRLYLDRQTALAQQNVGIKITSGFLGIKRMPFIIIDSPTIIKSREAYTARSAAALFFSLFGSDKVFALKNDMSLDIDSVTAFLEKHKEQQILLFGFTFMVWQHLYCALRDIGVKLDFHDGILIHSGGWKKMESMKVSSQIFKEKLKEQCNINHIFNEYGMAEQSGTIYFECEHGFFHTSIFSDIITRRGTDLSICDFGEPGMIELVSVLPHSYPGHILLSEDEGVICGEDDCPCGRLGKYFHINGRLKNAELRGCSDTYAVNF
ncbi:MAG: acyl-protein synthetase [Lachnospiraceae bacterium]|nr:acyl-protein synthetase [Lachnospiraceae bacterium]